MKTTIIILIFFSVISLAQVEKTKTVDTIKLKEINVFSNRFKENLMSTNAYYAVISGEDFKYSSINEIIEKISSIDVRQRGINGVQADISYRGSNYEQVLIMVDGSPVNDAQTGHHNANIPVPLENIEYIEVFSGSIAYLYGNSAYSAVVNIVTKNYLSNSIGLSTEFGDYKYFRQFVALNYKIKNLTNNLSFNYKKSNGCYENTDFRIKQFYLKQNYIKNNNSLSFLNSLECKDFGALNFYTIKYPYQYEKLYTILSKLAYNYLNENYSIFSSLNYRFSQDRFELFRENYPDIVIPSFYKNHNYHQTHSLNYNIIFVNNLRVGKISSSFNYYFNNIFSNVLGKNVIDTVYSFFDKDAFYNRSSQRNHYTFSSNYNKDSGKINGGIGFIFLIMENFKNVYPSLDISYRLNNDIKICYSYSYSYRIPSFTELYYKDLAHEGNAYLKPENCKKNEAGIKAFYDKFNYEVFLFYNNTHNSICWVKNDINEKWHTENILSLNSYGLTTDMEYKIQKKYVDKIEISYTHLKINSSNKYKFYKYLTDVPENKLHFSASLNPFNKTKITINTNFVNRKGKYIDLATGVEKTYKNYFVCDVFLCYSLSNNITLYLSILNVFNDHYVEYTGIYGCKRWFTGGIKCNKEFN